MQSMIELQLTFTSSAALSGDICCGFARTYETKKYMHKTQQDASNNKITNTKVRKRRQDPARRHKITEGNLEQNWLVTANVVPPFLPPPYFNIDQVWTVQCQLYHKLSHNAQLHKS